MPRAWKEAEGKRCNDGKLLMDIPSPSLPFYFLSFQDFPPTFFFYTLSFPKKVIMKTGDGECWIQPKGLFGQPFPVIHQF